VWQVKEMLGQLSFRHGRDVACSAVAWARAWRAKPDGVFELAFSLRAHSFSIWQRTPVHLTGFSPSCLLWFGRLLSLFSMQRCTIFRENAEFIRSFLVGRISYRPQRDGEGSWAACPSVGSRLTGPRESVIPPGDWPAATNHLHPSLGVCEGGRL
jgi:hypothetical protein